MIIIAFIVQGAKVFPVQDFCETCIKERHKIHEIYHPQLDNLAETSFGDATNYINTQFKQKLKPRIEAMYADCMKNCMLISDPEIRRKVEEKINHEVYQAVYNAFLNVMKAYSIGPGGYPQTCNCNEELIAELREKERKEFEEAEYYKTIMENKARKEFEAGIIKESSQLYQRLDKYTANVKLMFFEGKWHPLKTEVKFKAEVPVGNFKIGGNLNWVTEHVRNTTTYGGGLSGSTSVGAGPAQVKGTLSLQAQVTTDGDGNIVRSDVVGSVSGSVSAGMHEATGTFEVSALRGCKLSGEVTRMTGAYLKPPGADDNWNEYEEAIGIFRPEAPKKTLWKGEYKLSE